MKIKEYDYGPIGARIRNARTTKKLTQEKLAEMLDVSCQHISEIERGLSGLSLPSLMQICRILDVSADYILFGTSSKDNPIANLISNMSPQQALYAEEILSIYAKACKVD